MRIILGDRKPEMFSALEEQFSDAAEVTVVNGDILAVEKDSIMSPANSFGFMDGGIDQRISELFEFKVEALVQRAIKEKHGGELPVGAAEIIKTGLPRFKFLICAPTMRTPQNVAGTLNAYLAMRATLLSIIRFNDGSEEEINSVVRPGLCTGVGRMPPERSARQMKAAYNQVLGPNAGDLKSLSVAHTEEFILKL